MSTFVIGGADQAVLLHHLAFYGLAEILADSGTPDVRLSWDGARPVISGSDVSPERVDEAVRDHVTGRRMWVDREIGAERRGLMSPRLSVLKDQQAWEELQDARHDALQGLTVAHAWADLRYLAALGEPCYWSAPPPRRERRQDDGAARLEMQPRNRGSEFVGNRLRPLAEKLAARRPGAIAAGLAGTAVVDELGGKPDSVTATGLAIPGPVDSAVVWCGLWGIGHFPIAPRIDNTALASGYGGRSRREWFVVPVWEGVWRPARLRGLLGAAAVVTAATPHKAESLDAGSAMGWLRDRGVVGLARFPIGRFGSDNAPERRALRADFVSLRERV